MRKILPVFFLLLVVRLVGQEPESPCSRREGRPNYDPCCEYKPQQDTASWRRDRVTHERVRPRPRAVRPITERRGNERRTRLPAAFVRGEARSGCCNASELAGAHQTITITRGTASLSFRVFWENEADNFTRISQDSMKNCIRLTLERLPTAHLRLMQSVAFIIGKRCSGGGSLPCRTIANEFGSRACMALSYECFRATGDRHPYTCDERVKHDNGAWNVAGKYLLTLLHEVGHFMDYHYSILYNLQMEAKLDCCECAIDSGCYGDGATKGAGETIAQSYMTYFKKTTYREVLGCAAVGDCTSSVVPRDGTHPSTEGILTENHRAYLTNSLAWETWD